MKDCFNAGEYSGHCGHHDHYQQGGGWTPRSYVFCVLLGKQIYTAPVVPQMKGHMLEPFTMLLPDDCPVKRGAGQMSLFEGALNGL